MYSELLKFYKEIKAVENVNRGARSKEVYKICSFAQECLGSDDDRETGCDTLAMPYIGCMYSMSKPKILIVGLNGCGSKLESQYKMMLDTIICFLDKQKKVRFSNPPEQYRGTITYHRAIVYASIILNHFNQISLNTNDVGNDFNSLAKTVDYIAFLEAVKCSGKNLIDTMKLNCEKSILRKEIEILNPDYLLVLGKTTLQGDWMKIKKTNDSSNKHIVYSESIINKKNMKIFTVTHPTARRSGGGNTGIFDEFLEFIGTLNL